MRLLSLDKKRIGASSLAQINHPPSAHGVTLVELLVASTLSIFVLGGVLRVFDNVRENNAVIRSISAVQDAGWSAIRLMSQDVTMAGFGGCTSGDILVNAFTMRSRDYLENTNLFNDAIVGYTVTDENNWQTGYGATEAIATGINDPVVGSDVVRIMRAGSQVSVLASVTEGLEEPVEVKKSVGVTFNNGDNVLLSDCTSAEVFRVTNEPDNEVETGVTIELAHSDGDANRESELSKRYGMEASVRTFSTNYYYVAYTGRKDASGNETRALYRLPLGGEPVELVDGVNSLQVRYGERMSGDQVRYADVSNDEINWSNVVSLRLGLLVSSQDLLPNIEEDSYTYHLAGVAITPSTSESGLTHSGDRRLRRAFNTTIHLHNKSPALAEKIQ